MNEAGAIPIAAFRAKRQMREFRVHAVQYFRKCHRRDPARQQTIYSQRCHLKPQDIGVNCGAFRFVASDPAQSFQGTGSRAGSRPCKTVKRFRLLPLERRSLALPPHVEGRAADLREGEGRMILPARPPPSLK